VRFN